MTRSLAEQVALGAMAAAFRDSTAPAAAAPSRTESASGSESPARHVHLSSAAASDSAAQPGTTATDDAETTENANGDSGATRDAPTRQPDASLPAGWQKITHDSGLPCYVHEQLRLVCWSKPYVLDLMCSPDEFVHAAQQHVPPLSLFKAPRESRARSESIELRSNGSVRPRACVRTFVVLESERERRLTNGLYLGIVLLVPAHALVVVKEAQAPKRRARASRSATAAATALGQDTGACKGARERAVDGASVSTKALELLVFKALISCSLALYRRWTSSRRCRLATRACSRYSTRLSASIARLSLIAQSHWLTKTHYVAGVHGAVVQDAGASAAGVPEPEPRHLDQLQHARDRPGRREVVQDDRVCWQQRSRSASSSRALVHLLIRIESLRA